MGLWQYASALWLAVCCAALLYLCVYGDHIPTMYKGKASGIFCCLAAAVLSAISYAGGELYWLDIPAGKDVRKTAARMTLVFLAGTALQILYAVYAVHHGGSSLLQDSMATSGIFCVTAMAAGRMALLRPAPASEL